jgi:DNA-binding CsgD family transcriptional regulator
VKPTEFALPGVILFSSTRQILCYDDRAEHLLGKTRPVAMRRRKPGLRIPRGMSRCCADVMARMRANPTRQDCKEFKSTRLLRYNAVPLIFSAVGFPRTRGNGGPLVLILVEELEDQAVRLSYRATEVLGLHRDEQALLHYLLQGWTNKEIAEALSIPEASIKGRLRLIMERTNSWTRAALVQSLLRLLGLSPS